MSCIFFMQHVVKLVLIIHGESKLSLKSVNFSIFFTQAFYLVPLTKHDDSFEASNSMCKAYQAKFILETRSCTKCSLNSVFSNVFLAKSRKTHCTVVASKNKMQVNDCGMRNLSSPALVNTVEPRLSAHFSLVQFFHEYQETQSHQKPNTPFKRLLKQCIIMCASQNSQVRRDKEIPTTTLWVLYGVASPATTLSAAIRVPTALPGLAHRQHHLLLLFHMSEVSPYGTCRSADWSFFRLLNCLQQACRSLALNVCS